MRRWGRSIVLGASVAMIATFGALPAEAQTKVLTRTDFVLLWSRIVADDPRFKNLGHFGLDADLVDYGTGRLVFTADYEAILGNERRSFDINQDAFQFGMDLTRRTRAAEIAAYFAHVSRHAVDRENPDSISWNVLGARARRQWRADEGRTTIDGRFEIARAMQQAFVDYEWVSHAEATFRRTLPSQPRVAVFAEAAGSLIWTDPSMYGRERLCGGRIEGGVRLSADRAGVEIFVGYERRIDAYPTDLSRVRMWTIGFRVLNK